MWEAIWRFLADNPGLTIVGAVTLIQIAPIKIDPWSAVLRWIRKAIIGDIDTKLDSIARKVDGLEEQAKEDKALQARTHILRFADELYDGRHHSQEYFLQMLDDIKMYEDYCKDHADFRNGRTVQGCELIRTTFSRLWNEHSF